MTVSICMITYNHQPYISQAIESVLSQLCNFEFRLFIGEDCSTDNTRSICKTYAEKYPHQIELITSDYNVGMMENFIRTLQKCNGKYIAFIEGDDYWTDVRKLQKQVSFLQENDTYSACFHNVEIKMNRTDGKKEWILHTDLVKDSFTTEDILGPWFIPSPSFVFVNYQDLDLPSWFFHCKYGDLPLMLLLSLRGPVKYIPDVMAIYRLHDAGMSVQHKQYDKIILMTYIYESFNIHTKFRYADLVRKAVKYEIGKHLPNEEVIRLNKALHPAISTRQKIKRLLQLKS